MASTKRQEFTDLLKQEVYRQNALSVLRGVQGVMIEEQYVHLKNQGLIYYCENCKFCHTDTKYFSVDHLVPDFQMRLSDNRADIYENAIILCWSYEAGARGCNNVKKTRSWPPPGAGLANTRPELDMNWAPRIDRDANTHWE